MSTATTKDAVSRFRLAIASDTMIRGNQSGLGTSSDGNTYTLSGAVLTWSITSNEAVGTGATGISNALLGSGALQNVDALIRFSASTANDAPSILLRYVDVNNYYRIRATAGAHVTIAKVVAGTQTTIGSFNIAMSNSTFYWLRARAVGSVLYVKVWLASGPEPAAWNGSVVDSALTAAGQYGFQTNLTSVGDTVKFDHFSVTNVYVSDIMTRFGLTTASRALDAITRMRVQSGTTYHDALSRLGLLATKSVDTSSRFRLLQTKTVDTLSRFRLQSLQQSKDGLSRFRLLQTKAVDGLSRFRLLSTKSIDALSRFRVQSGIINHDASTRFRLGTINQKTVDALSRFRLLTTKSVDVLSRFRVQSGLTYHDALSRFKQQSGAINHDVNSRFRLLVPLARDTPARFRQQATTSRDTSQRFRVQQSTLLNAIMRMRLQSSIQIRGVQTRYKLQSGLTKHDAVSRHRLLSTASLNALLRFCQLALVSKNAQFRFCLFTSILARDAVARFGLALAPNVTFYVRSGSVLVSVIKGDSAFYVQSGSTLVEVRGI